MTTMTTSGTTATTTTTTGTDNTEVKKPIPKMKILIEIDENDKILLIGDIKTESGGRVHFEQRNGAAFIVKTSPTGAVEKSQGVTIGYSFREPNFNKEDGITSPNEAGAPFFAVAASEKDIDFRQV